MRLGSLLPNSITARLIVGLTLGITLLWCAAAAYSTYTSYRELDESFDQVLREAARRLLPLAADDVLGHEQDDDRAVRRFMDGRADYLSYQLRDRAGRIVLRSHDAPAEPFNGAAEAGFSTVGHYRLFTDTDELTGLTITVAETTKGRREATARGAAAMLWPLAAFIPLSILGIWWAVRSAMRPVSRLREQIAQRGGDNLAPLDVSGQPRELQPIADAVARLVERLSAALDAERAFAANSAHELRTPIAGALAQTQRLLAELDRADDRRRVRELEATLKRLSHLAEKLMQLSRVDAGVGFGGDPVDLIPVLDLVVSDCAKSLASPSRIRYAKSPGARLVGRIDMDAFAIAIRNLLDNAVNHGSVDGPIDVVLEADGRIRIVNDGPVVPPETLARLTRRFARGETRSAGAGLGLAIVETILHQAGGDLGIASPAPGRAGGFEAVLTVPPDAASGSGGAVSS